ncbi:hypothetical protein Poli38472_012397 [Pythium oligandrum]|uniref:BHLH domain-containing protein n=1 Tax=Pythium oligandrum TaxID=41045 RepID=A0A8K1CP82_PYTOL|nr:hypothetical protein Poli38472_012397 [Pythium oligandrum]|eukprot:TMW67281.1 hypothetical protein Poli38472_012397 [Pythium oligandrum]
MLATPNDFGYSTGHHANGHHVTHHYAQNGYEQHHQQSGERPKLFSLDQNNGHGGMPGLNQLHGGMQDFPHMMNPGGHHSMTPQHHQGSEFDHEPLMMNMHNPSSHFYPPMGTPMLHVSADYAGSMDGSTPSAGKGGSKRSREELNLKEKKRMFKLNDRITSLKALLDEAGVQSKKNKQSILDNTFHYVSMLRSNLVIAKQKAERAEKQAETYRSQVQKSGGGADQVFKRAFQQSTTPRLLVDLNMEPVTFNMAFLSFSGLNEDTIRSRAMRPSLCLDEAKLDHIVNSVKDTHKPSTAVVQVRHASGVTSATLMASVMTDETGMATHIEFSIIPFEMNSDLSPQPTFHNMAMKGDKETSPSTVSDLEL